MSYLNWKKKRRIILSLNLFVLLIILPNINVPAYIFENVDSSTHEDIISNPPQKEDSKDSQELNFKPPTFNRLYTNKWKENTQKADQNGNGINDQFEDKLNSLSETGTLKVSNKNDNDILSKEDIINAFFGNEKQDLEEISNDHIPIIIQFPEGDYQSISSLFENLGGEIKSTYKIAINGFAGTIDYDGFSQFSEMLNRNDVPFLIEEDGIVEANLYYTSRNMNLRPYVWNNLSYTGDKYSSIAVIDTGIDDSHNFFTPGYSDGNFNFKIVGWRDEVNGQSTPYDDNGHGSHCSGIATGGGSPTLDGNGRSVATFGFGLDYPGYSMYPGIYDITAARFNVTEAGEDVDIDIEFTDYTSPDRTYIYAYLYHNETIVDSYVSSASSWTDSLSYTITPSTLGDYSLRISLVFVNISGDYVEDPHFRFRGIIHWPFDPPLFGSGDPWKGVAPDTHLVGVKVLNEHGGGYTSDIVDGLDWIITNKEIYNITTISMSLGGGAGEISMINAVNNAVENGIVTVVAAGNDGGYEYEIGSPGDADNVITVAAMNSADNVTEYSSSGGPSYTGNTMKPDIMATGGSTNYFQMFSTDTNDNDAEGEYSTDGYLNDLYGAQGTSMATPAVAGATNLLIEAMGGHQNWNYTGIEAKKVKALLLMTATETYPLKREITTSQSPVLNRGGKDPHEGYGRINIDAAIEAITQELAPKSNISAWLTSSPINPFGKHALGCYVRLNGSENYKFTLSVPAGADFDLYLYNKTGSPIGDPVMLASSNSAVLGKDETLIYGSTEAGQYFLVAKAISGQGYANISFLTNDFPPAQTNGMVNPSLGNQTTLLNFSVVYTDPDDMTPTYVKVLINGTPYTMEKQNPSDMNYTDGCLYQYLTYLQPGIYNYSFEAKDGRFLNKTNTITGLTINGFNFNPPSLNNGEVNPSIGIYNNTIFRFEVSYTDSDNNAPAIINVTIKSNTYLMTKQDPLDNNYMDGCIFYYETNFTKTALYSYYFNATDGGTSVSDGPYTGPDVVEGGEAVLQNYKMVVGYPYNWIDATIGTRANLAWADDEAEQFSLPFEFQFYNTTFNSIYVCTNGFASFVYETEWDNEPFPDSYYPYMIAPFWSDLEADSPCNIFVRNMTSPNRFVIEWLNYESLGGPEVGTFQIILYENGYIIFNFDNITYVNDGYTCGLNFGLDTQLYNSYQNLNNSVDNFSIQFSRPINTHVPQLSSGSLNPTSGFQNTQVNFSVLYTDEDNNFPLYINTVINGTIYPMEQQNLSDNNCTDGKVFQLLTYIQPAAYNYTYHFVCGDGKYINSTHSFNDLNITESNSIAPILTYGKVNPTLGYNGTTLFTFSVNYTDADNNGPSYMNVTINSITYSMSKEDTLDNNFMDACVYIYRTVLNEVMTYTYYFNCSDGVFNASIGPFIGPTVEKSLFFDGMYISHTIDFSGMGSGSSSFLYPQHYGNIFNVTWDNFLFPGSWQVDLKTRIMSNPTGLHFGSGTHTPAWIFINVSIGDFVLIAVDGEGDHTFKVTGETVRKISGSNGAEAWVLEDQTTPGGIAYYEKNTGILLDGTFYYAGGDEYIKFDFVGSNVEFPYVKIEDTSGNDDDDEDDLGFFLIILIGAVAGIAVLVSVLYIKKKRTITPGKYDKIYYDKGFNKKYTETKVESSKLPLKAEIPPELPQEFEWEEPTAPEPEYEKKAEKASTLIRFEKPEIPPETLQKFEWEVSTTPEPKIDTIIEEKSILPEFEKPKDSLIPIIPPTIPLKQLKIGLICSSCVTVNLLPKDEMDKFTCKTCSNTSFGVGYFCSTCNKNYVISKDDFTAFQEPKTLDCPVCNNKIELVKKEE